MDLFLTIVLVIIVGDSLFGMMVEWLNLKALRTKLPDEFEGYYSAEKYRQSQEYLRDQTRLGMMKTVVILPLIVGFILWGGFQSLDEWVRAWGYGPIVNGLIFIGVLSVGLRLLSLPFSIYDTFVIEEKYGFNQTTFGLFVSDLIRGTLLGAVIGGGILALVLWFFEATGTYAWFYAWAGLSIIQVVLLFVAPTWIMPLFNKFEPLEEGELKQEIEAFAKKENFQLQGLFKMDGSKRSTKANAFFTGFGKNRRIVLFDTLIEKHTVPELVAILAHEIGHYKMNHIFRMFGVSLIVSLLMLYLFSIMINHEGLFAAFQMEQTSIYASLVFISLLYAPLSRILGVVSMVLSRKHEFEADAYAVKTYGHPKDLIEGLKKLSVDSLSNLTPHPIKVFLEYSHPPVIERVKRLRSLMPKKGLI